MAIDPNRPVISYENIALFKSNIPAHNADSNSGENLSFLPLVQSIDFFIDVARTNAAALGTKDFIDQSNRSAPDVNLTINTIENFGNLFSDLVSGTGVRDDLNIDANFYAALGEKMAFDVSKDSLIGREILSFGNCFLNNLSMSQSTKGLLTSEYTYVGSNIEAQTLSSSSLEKASGSAPSVNLSGDQAQSVDCSFDAMSSYYTNSSSEIIPSYNTNISISGAGSLGNFLIKSDSIQSFDLNLPINRKTIYSLGKKYPVKRKALFPSAGSFSFSNLVSSFELGGDTRSNLKTFLNSDEDYFINIAGQKIGGSFFNTVDFKIENAKLVSQSQTSTMEQKISANLEFSFELNNFKRSAGAASMAYSLRDLNNEQGGNNDVIKARKVVGGSSITRKFKANELSRIEDWAKNRLDNDFNFEGELKDAITQQNLTTSALTIQWSSSYRDVDISSIGSQKLINLIHKNSKNSNGDSIFSVGTYEVTFQVTQNGGVDIESPLSYTSQSRIELIVRDDDNVVETPDSANKIRFPVKKGANKFLVTVFDDGSASGMPAITLFLHQRAEFDITISNIELRHFTNFDSDADAYVETWYDQSGNTNHATQTDPTKQPKIVNAGALVTRTINGKKTPSIKFSAGQNMDHGLTSLSSDGQQSLFIVFDNQLTSNTSSSQTYSRQLEIVSNTSIGDGRARRPLIFTNDLTREVFFSVDTSSGPRRTQAQSNFLSVYSSITTDAPNPSDATENGTHVARQDGTQFGSEFVTLDNNATISTNKRLGFINSNLVGNFFISEIVYYPSDQSANRVAIEKNIKNYYKTN